MNDFDDENEYENENETNERVTGPHKPTLT